MPDTTDPVAAYLAEVRERAEAATPGPWSVTEQHGVDICDEAWSQATITAPSSRDACGNNGVAMLYWTSVIEPDQSEEDGTFITSARGDIPRLLAALEAVLKLHRRSPFPATSGEDRGKYYCMACTVQGDPWTPTVYAVWPCGEYQAIARELLGEGNDSG